MGGTLRYELLLTIAIVCGLPLRAKEACFTKGFFERGI